MSLTLKSRATTGRNSQFRPWPEWLGELFGVAAPGVLVADGLVEGVRVGSAVRCVENHHLAASGASLLFQRLHQQLPDAAAAEALADDEACHFDAGLVALDQVLDVEDAEPRDVSVQLGDDEPGRGIRRDALDPLGGLLGSRRVAELTEKLRNGGGVLGPP